MTASTRMVDSGIATRRAGEAVCAEQDAGAFGKAGDMSTIEVEVDDD